jgi:hypothetical protein
MSAVLSRKRVTTAARFGLAAYMGLSLMASGPTNAQDAKPIQSAITGNEDLGDLSQPQHALAQFYRAFNTRDLKMIDENFAHSDEVAIDNPLGGIRRGADEPHKMYEGQRTFTSSFGITPFSARAMYFGPSVGSAARIVMARP